MRIVYNIIMLRPGCLRCVEIVRDVSIVVVEVCKPNSCQIMCPQTQCQVAARSLCCENHRLLCNLLSYVCHLNWSVWYFRQIDRIFSVNIHRSVFVLGVIDEILFKYRLCGQSITVHQSVFFSRYVERVSLFFIKPFVESSVVRN